MSQGLGVLRLFSKASLKAHASFQEEIPMPQRKQQQQLVKVIIDVIKGGQTGFLLGPAVLPALAPPSHLWSW